jgi:GNAT superfamily N-acetyltransferase
MASRAPAEKVPTIGFGTLMQLPTLRLIARRVGERLWSSREAIGFRRDLALPFTAPEAKLPLVIVELGPDELPAMLDPSLAGASALDSLECASRRALWQRHFGRCFVARAPDGQAGFLQWLFDHRDNAALATHFGDAFPVLAEGEALLEGAYTPAAFRGQRIMPAAMARIAERAADTGARYVHTFVGIDNMPSLKGCVRAGFPPHQWRTQHLRLFKRHTDFTALPPTFERDYAAICN